MTALRTLLCRLGFYRKKPEPLSREINELCETYGKVTMPDGNTYEWDAEAKAARLAGKE